MSGMNDLYKLTKFSGIKTTKWCCGDKGEIFFLGMSVRETYRMLESLNPGCLKRDVTRYAKANGLFAQSLGNSSDVQLLRLKMAQLHGFPHSRQKILKGGNTQQVSLTKRCNWSQISLHTRHQKSHEWFKPCEIS